MIDKPRILWSRALKGVEQPEHVIAEVATAVRVEAIAMRSPKGGYTSSVPALPGCFAVGLTLDEALANVAVAASAWIESRTARLFPADADNG